MAVYIDPLVNYGWRLGPSCHMTADTLDELHAMAAKLWPKVPPRTLRGYYFQGPPNHIPPHYDLTEGKRRQALHLGAVELDLQTAARRITAAKLRALRGLSEEEIAAELDRRYGHRATPATPLAGPVAPDAPETEAAPPTQASLFAETPDEPTQERPTANGQDKDTVGR